MALKLMTVPHCCGAKFFYGFPSGYDEGHFSTYKNNPTVIEELKRFNDNLTETLDREMEQFLHGEEYTAFFVRENRFDSNFPADAEENRVSQVYKKKHYPLLKKNAFISAILNSKQRSVCEPVLFKYGFQLTMDAVNPNTHFRLYHYTMFPNGR